MILGAADLVVGQMSFAAQREIYADGPDTGVCVALTPHATAVRCGGGWRLSGEWFPASGCLHATWGVFGFPIAEGEVGVAAIPLSELRIKDTWHTVGMRGTAATWCPVRALDLLISADGAAAVAESSPLNVLLRDMQTAHRHAMINPSWNTEACGRALLGVEPNISPLV